MLETDPIVRSAASAGTAGDDPEPTPDVLPSPPSPSTLGGLSPPTQREYDVNDILQIIQVFGTECVLADSKAGRAEFFRGEHVRVIKVDDKGDLLV